MSEKPTPLLAVLQLLRKYNLKGTEDILRREANIGDVDLSNIDVPESDLTNILSHHSDNDPYTYDLAYDSFNKMIDESLDIYKFELSLLLYPVLVHMYIGLLSYDYEDQARRLLEHYAPLQEECYQEDLKKLSAVTKKDFIKGNEIAENFTNNKFSVVLSRDASSILKRYINEQKLSTIIPNIITNHVNITTYEGANRSATTIYTSGAMMGESVKLENRSKVYYGLLKEPDVQSLIVHNEEDDDAEETPDKPKKKKPKKDPLFSKKTKSDPNAPPSDRIPLPDLKEVEKMEKVRALREATKRVALGQDTLPSICFYTLLNCNHATSIDIADDSSLLAVGFANSIIKVWTLTPVKLRGMKSADKLQDIDREAGDVLVRMMEEKDRDSVRTLYGHSGPVYQVHFDPYKNLLLSCSEDGSIRLWSLLCWTCLVVYKGHIWPVWTVKWSPYGHYFASAGHDRSARLWSTDSYQALRVFVGHLSDIDCLVFHPNCNYIATGSSDRTVRVWDCLTGNQVRIMTGHKSSILNVLFSTCGRWLASSGKECVIIWDISTANLTFILPHKMPVYSLAFSRDGTVLATGSQDYHVRLWDFTAITETSPKEETTVYSYNKLDDKYLLRSFATKNAPISYLHFTRRNLLMAVGPFEGSA